MQRFTLISYVNTIGLRHPKISRLCINLAVVAATVVGALLIERAWEVNTGALEIERWSKTHVSSKTALLYVVLVSYSWLGLLFIEKALKRIWFKAIGFAIHFAIVIAIANFLAYVTSPIDLG